MKKILIQQGRFFHYRKDLFNVLAKKYDVTVFHSGKKMKKETDIFKEVISPQVNIFTIKLQPKLIREVFNNKYDYIILLFNFNYLLNFITLVFINNRKVVLWGSWLTGKTIFDKVRLFIMRSNIKNILYSIKHYEEFKSAGVSIDKLYIANNTIHVKNRIKAHLNIEKNTILFVGSFDERKEIGILIDAFCNILKRINSDIKLVLIGDGYKYIDMQEKVDSLGISNRVVFMGRITNNDILIDEYRKAIVSVSLGQAGLSVLQSLSCGVPFLTKYNAVSGGEKSNIRHNINSVFCNDSLTSVEDKLVSLCTNISFSRMLGENAFNYYTKFCSIENMAQGFADVIENTRLANVDKFDNLK